MNVTIKDIAKKLDINFSSVSRALNNKAGVSQETRRLVVKTAKEMGYRPNVIARGLVTRVTKTIGVIIPDILNPIFGEITTGIIETANEMDYDVFLCISNWNEQKEEDNIHIMQQKQVDGIIIKNVCDADSRLLNELNVPVVLYETWAAESRLSSVSTDNERGGYLAAKHIIECGYKKPAMISGPVNSSASKNRRNGFYSAYMESGVPYEESLLYTGEYTIESGYMLAQQLFKGHNNIDSVFASNDVMALGFLQYLVENGIKPGEEFGVIGFDDINLSHLPQIRLTTITQPKYTIGRIMTKLLLDEIKNYHEGIQNLPQRILLEPELIVRGTTAKQR